MRPASIRMFESLWGALLVFTLVNMAVSWPIGRRAMAVQLAPLGYDPTTMLAIADVLGLLVPLLVWLFVRRRSRIARGFAVLLSVYNGWILLGALASGHFGGGFVLVLAVVCVSLEIAATIMLFRADARAWFARPMRAAE